VTSETYARTTPASEQALADAVEALFTRLGGLSAASSDDH
jgi:hypothetical protein